MQDGHEPWRLQPFEFVAQYLCCAVHFVCMPLARPHKSQCSAQWTPAKAWLSSQLNFDPRDCGDLRAGSRIMVHGPLYTQGVNTQT